MHRSSAEGPVLAVHDDFQDPGRAGHPLISARSLLVHLLQSITVLPLPQEELGKMAAGIQVFMIQGDCMPASCMVSIKSAPTTSSPKHQPAPILSGQLGSSNQGATSAPLCYLEASAQGQKTLTWHLVDDGIPLACPGVTALQDHVTHGCGNWRTP